MIQRIQTIWLTISVLLPIYLLKGAIAKFQATDEIFYTIGSKGVILNKGLDVEIIKSTVAIPTVIFLIIFCSLIALFLYRNRKIQKLFTLAAFTVSFCLLVMEVLYVFQIYGRYDAAFKFVPGCLVPPILCLITILAFRGIVKDEKIIRSYDRLR